MKRADSAAGKATAGGSEAHGAQQHHGRVSDTDRSVSRPAAAPSRTHSRPPQSISDSSMAQPRCEGMGAAAGASCRAAAGAAGAPNHHSRAPPLLSRPLQRPALLPHRQPPPQQQPAPQPLRQPLQQQQAPHQPKAQQQRQMPPAASAAHSIQPSRVQLPQPPRTSTASAATAASARSAAAAVAAAQAPRQLAPLKPIAQPAAPKQLQQTDKSKQKQRTNAGAAVAAAAADNSKNSSTSRVQGKRPGSKLSAVAANDGEEAAAAPPVKKARVAAKREDEKGRQKAESSASAAAAAHSGLGAAPHADEAPTTSRAAPLPAKHPQRKYSLFSPDVLCEVVLLGEEREQIAAQLNWTPSANSDSDSEGEGEEEENAGDDDWLPSNKSKPLHVRGAPMSEADPDSIGDDQAADADRSPDLMAWLQCVMHSSSPDRMWGCWCGVQPHATFRVVRRHIREAHGGIIDPPSPVAASGRGPGNSGQLAEDASGPSGLLQPTVMRSNVRVQLPPPPMQGRQVRTQ